MDPIPSTNDISKLNEILQAITIFDEELLQISHKCLKKKY